MKKRLIVGNWKMHPDTEAEAEHLWEETRTTALSLKKSDVVLCVPYPYLGIGNNTKKGLFLGAQNLAGVASVGQTGEVSAAMLAESGARFVIVGHSERRALGETNEIVKEKVQSALRAGLAPIVCVGERVRDHDGFYLKEVATQVEEALGKVPKKDLAKVVIAYEPVWAIGKNAQGTLAPQDLLEMTLYIRRALMKGFGKEAGKMTLLYGGSVDAKNAVDFVREGGVEGLLVGRESLSAKNFSELLISVDRL